MTTHTKRNTHAVLLSASLASLAFLGGCSQADAAPSTSEVSQSSARGASRAEAAVAAPSLGAPSQVAPSLGAPELSVEEFHSVQASGGWMPGLIGAFPVTGIGVEIRYQSDADSGLGVDEQQGSLAGDDSGSKTTVQQPLTKSPKTIK